MLHRPVDHHILLAIILRLSAFGRLWVVRAVEQLEAKVHFRQGAELAETRDANFCASVAFSGAGLFLNLRLCVGSRSRGHGTALLFERSRSARNSDYRREHAHHQS